MTREERTAMHETPWESLYGRWGRNQLAMFYETGARAFGYREETNTRRR